VEPDGARPNIGTSTGSTVSVADSWMPVNSASPSITRWLLSGANRIRRIALPPRGVPVPCGTAHALTALSDLRLGTRRPSALSARSSPTRRAWGRGGHATEREPGRSRRPGAQCGGTGLCDVRASRPSAKRRSARTATP
jgi:hypothetical protein